MRIALTRHCVFGVHDRLKHGLGKGHSRPVRLCHLQACAEDDPWGANLNGALAINTWERGEGVQSAGTLARGSVARECRCTHHERVEHGQGGDACLSHSIRYSRGGRGINAAMEGVV